MQYKSLILVFSIFIFAPINSAIAFEEVLIPRSMSGDKGTYFLMNAEKKGSIIQTLHKRIGVDSIGYTRLEINCKSRIVRDLGYTDGALKKMAMKPSKWYKLVNGSSKSDLMNFVCENFS